MSRRLEFRHPPPMTLAEKLDAAAGVYPFLVKLLIEAAEAAEELDVYRQLAPGVLRQRVDDELYLAHHRKTGRG
jgi:hypothetical protein